MTEPKSEFTPQEEDPKQKLAKYIAIAEILSKKEEGFPFPGINPESYTNLMMDDENFPGITTPINEIIARMEKEGIRVTLGTHPESGNVFVLPMLSEDKNIGIDSIFPRHLEITEKMDGILKKLIVANKNIFLSNNSPNIP